MKNAVKEYIEYSTEIKNELWNSATFVFDTNVLLNLYRYSSNTRKQLIESFEKLKDRIWIPYQVAYEFCKDRYKVIDEANRRFDNLESEVNRLSDSWKQELRLDKNDADIECLVNYLNEWIDKKKTNSYQIFEPSNDDVFNKLLDLFDGKTGNKFSEDDIKNIETEGKQRYEAKIPPGYKDGKKQENKYGDLLVWKVNMVRKTKLILFL